MAKRKIRNIAAGIGLAAAMIGISAQPSSASVIGSIYNSSGTAGRWIMVSLYDPPTTTYKVYPGQSHTARTFVPLYDCRSTWGYVYKSGVWYKMSTTSTLVLNCG